MQIFYIVRTAEVRCTSNSCRIGAPNPETRKRQTARRVSKGPPTTKSAQKTEDFEPLSTDPSGNALGICGKTAEKAADSVYVAQHTQVAAQVCAG